VSDRLLGKVALVTGAASGMGEATSRRFAAEGARVFLADFNESRGEEVAAQLAANGHFHRLDVRSAEEWSGAVEHCINQFGRIDILINSAGIGRGGRIEDETPEDHELLLRTNVTGVWNGIRAVLPTMSEQRSGAIINISSIDGLVGVPGVASYVASKFAVTGMTKSVALEVGHRGIRVNSIHPGAIATPMMSGHEDTVFESLQIAQQAIPRLGRAEEIAQLALFLASDESSYCTGASFVIDGGHTAGPYRASFPYD
jgi:3alpha(or 20beta)-hydroxysteroid dehydrogenase